MIALLLGAIWQAGDRSYLLPQISASEESGGNQAQRVNADSKSNEQTTDAVDSVAVQTPSATLQQNSSSGPEKGKDGSSNNTESGFKFLSHLLDLIASPLTLLLNFLNSYANLSISVFTFVLTIVSSLQYRVYRDQANSMKKQTSILEESRHISLAALERPYVFFKPIDCSLCDWMYGNGPLKIGFTFFNYGKSPAITKNIEAFSFISWSDKSPDIYLAEGEKINQNTQEHIQKFPSASEIDDFINSSFIPSLLLSRSYLDPASRSSARTGSKIEKLRVVIAGGTETLTIESVARAPSMPADREDTKQLRWLVERHVVVPYIMGRIDYDDMYGVPHHTSFCFRGNFSGTSVWLEEYGDAPYNERS